MRMLQAVVVASSLMAAACGGESTAPDAPAASVQSVQLGGDVRLRVNQAVTLSGTDLRVTFTGVTADSRCPIDAVCVWMGDAEAVLELTEGRAPVTRRTLHTGAEPKSVEFNNYRIELLEVAPARASDRAIPQRDYAVRLRISGR